jgi:hypothetical protein
MQMIPGARCWRQLQSKSFQVFPKGRQQWQMNKGSQHLRAVRVPVDMVPAAGTVVPGVKVARAALVVPADRQAPAHSAAAPVARPAAPLPAANPALTRKSPAGMT